MQRVATQAQRRKVLDAIDRAEREMLPGGLTADEMELASVRAELAINHLKNTGELRRREDARALADQIQWEIQ
jgi:hypothetical protein